jgi:dTDP-4-amino-4,6-dideoxygalactose transaminase
LHLQPCFGGQWGAGRFPHAEAACKELLALPIHPALPAGAQAHVVDHISAFYAR